MIVSDSHVHSTFSQDASTPMHEMLSRAIELKLKHINITDHSDYIYGETQEATIANMRTYLAVSSALKAIHKNDIYFGIGLEVSFNPKREQEIIKITQEAELEYIIQSVHDVKGADCYLQEYFSGKTKVEAYNAFLDEVIESLNVPYRFDAVGHLTYITRPSPYKDKTLAYNDYKLRLDKIISEMVKRDIILEFNTSTYSPIPGSLPGMDIAAAYYKAGGRKVTLSSDAHIARDLTKNFDIIAKDLKKIGFVGVTVKQNGNHIILPF